MTGPEHYKAAERLLDLASRDDLGSRQERYHLAKAQAHATLALAAATADPIAETYAGSPSNIPARWSEAIL